MANIPQGKNIPFGTTNSALPNMAETIVSWFLALTIERIVKTVVNYQVVETTTPESFMGVIQPLNNQTLMIKPEGQRAWKWYWLHCSTTVKLTVDDVFLYQGHQYRVMALKDYSEYGYLSYELIRDWTGAGPTVVEP
jgi:hypothetical protein